MRESAEKVRSIEDNDWLAQVEHFQTVTGKALSRLRSSIQVLHGSFEL